MLGAVTTCALATPSISRAQPAGVADPVRRNTSSFIIHDWQDHFEELGMGILLADTASRLLQHWAQDGEMRIYPTSVPMTDDLTRRGYTEIVRKVAGPSWAPTPSMKKRDPDLPDFVGPGPDNPLGTHALYLSWQYYRIHCRMWEFYLAACEAGFRYNHLVVFQIQLAHRLDAVPMTRDYIEAVKQQLPALSGGGNTDTVKANACRESRVAAE